MDRTALIQKIKARLDELTPLSGQVDHPIEESLSSFLDEAHRQILNEGPIHLLPVTEISSDDVVYDSTNDIAYVPVPDGFIRIISFKFENWTNPAIRFITQENPDYKLIENGYIVRNTVKPVVVLLYHKTDDDSTPRRYLKCYSVDYVDGEDPVENLHCIVKGEIDALIDQTTDALAWLTASKLMQAFEMPGYKLAQDRYNEFLLSNAR